MFRRSGAELSGVFLATLVLASCVPLEEKDDGCEPIIVYDQDPYTGQIEPIALPCRGPTDPDAKLEARTACDGLDAQLGGGIEIANGTSRFVAAFFTAENVIVVAKDRIELVDRQGQQLALVRWHDDTTVDGALDTAAFDGSTLVITAGTELVSYDTELQEVARATLPSECTSSVLLSGNLFVCGDPEENDRSFHVYDALTGSFLLTTTEYGFEEGPMGRARGRDAFLAVNMHTSARTLLMYAVDPDGTVTIVGRSVDTSHGSFSVRPLYAFLDEPATHLITDTGRLLCLTPEDCNHPTARLLPESDVVLLPEGRYFSAMDVDAAGKLHAFIGPASSSVYEPLSCDQGCFAQRIDVVTRITEASEPFEVPRASRVETLQVDPQGGLLLACGPGHRVMLLPDAP